MALAYTPHQLRVMRASQTTANGRANAVAYEPAATLAGQLSPQDPSEVYGTTIETKRPHKLLLGPEAAGLLGDGDRLEGLGALVGRSFTVVGPLRVIAHGLPTDHCKAQLEEREV